jgi:DNA polymerase (family 10)
VQGVFHCHSDWSDGTAPVVEMARAALELGYHYIGISDHSKAATYAGGLDEARLRKQAEVVEKAQKDVPGIRIFHGIEVDILEDGRLDLDDETLGQLDFVIASIHSRLDQPKEAMTERILRAVRHPLVTVIGHPTQRQLLGRPGYEVDLEAVAREAEARGVALEINAHHKRLDLDWTVVRRLRESFPGLRFFINPDAHSMDGLKDTELGVGVARKAWVQASEVINTLPVAEMESYLASRRAEARRSS